MHAQRFDRHSLYMIKILPVLLVGMCVVGLAACSSSRLVATTEKNEKADPNDLFRQAPFQGAHVGVCIYDVAADKYLYDYQSEKYFVPASNTKLFTLYAGLKYLGDSLPGMYYHETADTFYIFPSGDPTLLHPDFKKQPVIEKLQKANKALVVIGDAWKEEIYGPGWAWDDYNEGYMPERSALPVYGNTIKWVQVTQKNTQAELQDSLQTFVYSDPEVNWKVRFVEDTANKTFHVERKREENLFRVSQGKEAYKEQPVPFITNGLASALELLKDTVGREIRTQSEPHQTNLSVLHSQPSDSLFKIMMYRSDNFFAEQALLMASYERLKIMRTDSMINTLLATDLQALPQKPRWVDGSGLSRYNLFTPQDFVWILKKMKDDFGLEKMKAILPGSNQGTLVNYYKELEGAVFAKTGTLSGQIALSGYLTTRRNKLLIFSFLVNNQQGSITTIRRAVEKFLTDVWGKD